MIQQHIDYIRDNEHIFTSQISVSREVRQQVYDIYNQTFNKNKRPGGCGRCWSIVKKELYEKYKQQ